MADADHVEETLDEEQQSVDDSEESHTDQSSSELSEAEDAGMITFALSFVCYALRAGSTQR